MITKAEWESFPEKGRWQIGQGNYCIAKADGSDLAFARQIDCDLAIQSLRDARIESIEEFLAIAPREGQALLYRYLQW